LLSSVEKVKAQVKWTKARKACMEDIAKTKEERRKKRKEGK
jgi:hypothetical protein